jgi:hypothetical protein
MEGRLGTPDNQGGGILNYFNTLYMYLHKLLELTSVPTYVPSLS